MTAINDLRGLINTDYKELEYALHEILVAAGEQWQSLGCGGEEMQQLERCKELLRTRKYTVAVMGEFKRGKSTLINALLGEKILPADATPTTATLNRITYGAQPNAQVEYRDGRMKRIHIGELSDYVTKLTAAGEGRAARIKQVVVQYPTPLCQNHIDIVDTPGLNDDKRMTAITLDMLDQVDAVLVPIHARFPFSETECRFVCQLLEHEQVYDILFVVTFLDQLDEEDFEYHSFLQQIAQRIRDSVLCELEERMSDDRLIEKAKRVLGQIQICGISCTLALKAFVSNNRNMLIQSRFEEFRSQLVRVLTAKQLEHAVDVTVSTISHMARELPKVRQAHSDAQNRRLIASKKTRDAIQVYRTGARHQLDRILAESDAVLTDTVQELYREKNTLAKAFIQALSAQKPYGDEEINRILLQSARAGLDDMKERGISIAESISQHMQSAWEQYLSWRAELLCGAMPDDRAGTAPHRDSMMGTALDRLKKVRFRWSGPPAPKVDSYDNFDVTEHVITLIDQSVEQYILAFFAAIAAVRADWFAQLNQELDHLEMISDNEIQLSANIRRELELFQTRYTQAYDRMQKLTEQAARLVDSCSE